MTTEKTPSLITVHVNKNVIGLSLFGHSCQEPCHRGSRVLFVKRLAKRDVLTQLVQKAVKSLVHRVRKVIAHLIVHINNVKCLVQFRATGNPAPYDVASYWTAAISVLVSVESSVQPWNIAKFAVPKKSKQQRWIISWARHMKKLTWTKTRVSSSM